MFDNKCTTITEISALTKNDNTAKLLYHKIVIKKMKSIPSHNCHFNAHPQKVYEDYEKHL